MEARFKEMLKDPRQEAFVLSVGLKGSGKTYLVSQMLRWCMTATRDDGQVGLYEKYFVIAPTYKFEASNTYAFLNDRKWTGRAEVYVAEEYGTSLSQDFLNRDDAKKGYVAPRSMVFVDDLTAAAYDRLSGDPAFLRLVSIMRHKRVSLVLCHHSLRSGGGGGSSIINPFLRAQLSYIFLHKISNVKLAKSLYEEFVSINPECGGFGGFQKLLVDYVLKKAQEHNLLAIDCASCDIATDANRWFLVTESGVSTVVAPGGGKRGANGGARVVALGAKEGGESTVQEPRAGKKRAGGLFPAPSPAPSAGPEGT